MKGKKKTKEDFINRIQELGVNHKLIRLYIGKKHISIGVFICGNCGAEFRTTFDGLRKKCIHCRPYNIEFCKKIALKRGFECLSKRYVQNSHPVKWKCKKGHIWKNSLKEIMLYGAGCPYCYGRYITIKNVRKLALKRGFVLLSRKYINSKTNLIWRCKKNHYWTATYNSIQRGSGCPRCSWNKTSSKNENELYKIIKKYLKNKKQYLVRHNDRSILKNMSICGRNLEIDIVIYDKKSNQIILGIEWNGEYIHKRKSLKAPIHDLIKKKYFENNNINFIQYLDKKGYDKKLVLSVFNKMIKPIIENFSENK